MDAILKAIVSRLEADATLTGTGGGQLGAGVYLDRQPDDPKSLTHPAVVVQVSANPDLPGDHGGATVLEVEVRVWGFEGRDTADYPPCILAATRVDELMLKRFTINGVVRTARPGANAGWQRLDDQDPLVIHLLASYVMLYWSAGRVTALLAP